MLVKVAVDGTVVVAVKTMVEVAVFVAAAVKDTVKVAAGVLAGVLVAVMVASKVLTAVAGLTCVTVDIGDTGDKCFEQPAIIIVPHKAYKTKNNLFICPPKT